MSADNNTLLLIEIRNGILALGQRVSSLETALLAAAPDNQDGKGAAAGPPLLPSLQLPMSPRVLNEMINAVQIPGVATMGVNKLTVTVPAGDTVTVVMPTRPGTVAVATGPVLVTASYYSQAIVMDVFVDDQMVTSQDYQYVMTGEDQLHLGQYYYAQRNMTIVITNNTATSTTVTFRSEGLAIAQDFFQSFYVPLLNYGYRVMADMARIASGG